VFPEDKGVSLLRGLSAYLCSGTDGETEKEDAKDQERVTLGD
jgi:hypothetical protein